MAASRPPCSMAAPRARSSPPRAPLLAPEREEQGGSRIALVAGPTQTLSSPPCAPLLAPEREEQMGEGEGQASSVRRRREEVRGREEQGGSAGEGATEERTEKEMNRFLCVTDGRVGVGTARSWHLHGKELQRT